MRDDCAENYLYCENKLSQLRDKQNEATTIPYFQKDTWLKMLPWNIYCNTIMLLISPHFVTGFISLCVKHLDQKLGAVYVLSQFYRDVSAHSPALAAEMKSHNRED